MPSITVNGVETSIEVTVGQNMLDLCEEGLVPIALGCRAGACGTCRFRVIKNADALSPKTYIEEMFFTTFPSGDGYRLACQCKILKDLEIEVE